MYPQHRVLVKKANKTFTGPDMHGGYLGPMIGPLVLDIDAIVRRASMFLKLYFLDE